MDFLTLHPPAEIFGKMVDRIFLKRGGKGEIKDSESEFWVSFFRIKPKTQIHKQTQTFMEEFRQARKIERLLDLDPIGCISLSRSPGEIKKMRSEWQAIKK